MSTLNAMHEKMHTLLARLGGRVDAVFFCPHTAADGCDCRKPKPGMLEQISERFGIELRGVPIVGDSLRDLEAGVAVGCAPHLVRSGKGQKTFDQGGLPPGTQVHDDLRAFARWLTGNGGAQRPPAHSAG
ncbi:D-glycero-beta-D-manno-heptose-1,7-bisphosphate 7-phosphatase [compost metagenome]